MNNVEVIIEKILSDANAVAKDNISKAQQEVALIEASTNDSIQEYRKVQLQKGKKQAEDVIVRKRMVTNLDCKKIILSKKTALVDEVFASVAAKMRAKDPKAYVALISKMIEKSADDKDQVVISKFDKDLITEKVVSDIAKKIKKELTLSKDVMDFDGGVMLLGEKFDKNLTFEQEFSLIRQESELELAKILFGE